MFQERLLLEPMFEVPGSNVKIVHIDEDTVLGKQPPRYEYHTDSDSSSSSSKENAKDSDQTGTPEGDQTSTGNSEDMAVEQSAAAKAKI